MIGKRLLRLEQLGFVWDLFCLANVERREIVEDYQESEDFSLSTTHHRLIGVSDTANKYLDKGTLKQLGAPKYAMEAALDYLDKKYNGPCNYLDSIGFTEEWRDKLKD